MRIVLVSSVCGIAYTNVTSGTCNEARRFYSENKLVKQDTNCQLSLKICLFQQQAFKCEALN